MAYELSRDGAAFIASFEAIRLQAYNDSAGHCTIGIGHLIHHGPCTAAEPQARITKERAWEMFWEDCNRRYVPALDAVTVPLNQNQADALISFAFNVGAGAFHESTLLKKLNAGDYAAVSGELMNWVKTPGSEEGLKRRRRAEGEMFLRGGEPSRYREDGDD